MKLTTKKLKQLIKEELDEMLHDQQRFDQVEMTSIPDRQIPQIQKFKNLQKELERHYGDHQPAVAAEMFDSYQADNMEDLAFRIEQEMDDQGGQDLTGVVSDFVGFIRQVVNELE
tara:strand:+ start:238 stop:582 length:345 start_codon:yes stop_codon:yes gene_type:complete